MTRRVELAGARRAAAAARVEQVRERLARLRAGEPASREDVLRARASAENQHAEAVRAEERLRRVREDAEGLRRRWSSDAGDAGRTTAQVLRRALVTIAAEGEGLGAWTRERRQDLWELLSERCGADDWRGWSDALCRTAVRQVPGLRGAALNGVGAGQVPHLLAVSDERTRELEEVAELVGEGPGVEAHRTRRPVLVRDLGERQARWPAYSSAAMDLGLRTVYALPAVLDGVVLGALTLYPHDQRGTGWAGWTEGLYLAAAATRTLLADLDAVEQGWPSGELTDDRVQLATGMLACRLDISVADASARLRAFAFGNARPLGDVAQAVVDGTLRHL